MKLIWSGRGSGFWSHTIVCACSFRVFSCFHMLPMLVSNFSCSCSNFISTPYDQYWSLGLLVDLYFAKVYPEHPILVITVPRALKP